MRREAITSSSNVDLSRVPDHLKCPFSGKVLEDAVLLTCCKNIVSDSAIRKELLYSNLKCPLCETTNVSPDDVSTSLYFRFNFINNNTSLFILFLRQLFPQHPLRKAVEEYLAQLQATSDAGAGDDSAIDGNGVGAPASDDGGHPPGGGASAAAGAAGSGKGALVAAGQQGAEQQPWLGPGGGGGEFPAEGFHGPGGFPMGFPGPFMDGPAFMPGFMVRCVCEVCIYDTLYIYAF